jgi:hypothetical protein
VTAKLLDAHSKNPTATNHFVILIELLSGFNAEQPRVGVLGGIAAAQELHQ